MPIYLLRYISCDTSDQVFLRINTLGHYVHLCSKSSGPVQATKVPCSRITHQHKVDKLISVLTCSTKKPDSTGCSKDPSMSIVQGLTLKEPNDPSEVPGDFSYVDSGDDDDPMPRTPSDPS